MRLAELNAPTSSVPPQVSSEQECHGWDYGARLTDWRPRHQQHCQLYEDLAARGEGARVSAYELREHLRKRGLSLHEERMREMDKVVSDCNMCPGAGQGFPDYRYVVRCDAVSCKRTEVNPKGVGTKWELVEKA